jgi:hypothetical protein
MDYDLAEAMKSADRIKVQWITPRHTAVCAATHTAARYPCTRWTAPVGAESCSIECTW